MMHLLLSCRLFKRGRSIKACSRPICQGTYPAIGECVHTRCKLLTEIQHFLYQYHPLSSIIGRLERREQFIRQLAYHCGAYSSCTHFESSTFMQGIELQTFQLMHPSHRVKCFHIYQLQIFLLFYYILFYTCNLVQLCLLWLLLLSINVASLLLPCYNVTGLLPRFYSYCNFASSHRGKVKLSVQLSQLLFHLQWLY